jgi:plasmid stabilization system protein ParE
MDLKIFWTDTARINLEQIHNYYKTTANLKVAKHITNQISSTKYLY